MTKYPDSACEEHRNVETSEPVCVICLAADADRFRWLMEHWWFGNGTGAEFSDALTPDEVRAVIDAEMAKTQNARLTGATPEGGASELKR